MMNLTPYGLLLQKVQMVGAPVDSRMGPTREVYGLRAQIHLGLLFRRPGIVPALGWMELCQLIAGVFEPDAIERVAPNANHSLFTPQMAYGPRIVNQIEGVIEALRIDNKTRQAVLFIGNDLDGPTNNLPCTLSIQFLYRGSNLMGLVSMRSWDLVKGLPYDLVMFHGLLQVVAHIVGAKFTSLIVTAGSAHVYESDFAKIDVVQDYDLMFTVPHCGFEWRNYVNFAEDCVYKKNEWVGSTPSFVKISKWKQGMISNEFSTI